MISLKKLWLQPHDCSVTLRIGITIVCGILLGHLSYQGLNFIYDHVRQPLVIHEVINQTPVVKAGGEIQVKIKGTYFRKCPATGSTSFSQGDEVFPGTTFEPAGSANFKIGRKLTRVRSFPVPKDLPTGLYLWEILLQVECDPNNIYFPPVPPVYVRVVNDAEPPPS